MKKIIYSILLISGTCTFALAQSNMDQSNQSSPSTLQSNETGMLSDTTRHYGQGIHESIADMRTSMLDYEVTLTPEQTTQVKELFTQQEKEIAESRTRNNASENGVSKKEMKALFGKHQQEISALLTPEQLAKLDAVASKQKEKFLYNQAHYMGQYDKTQAQARHNKK